MNGEKETILKKHLLKNGKDSKNYVDLFTRMLIYDAMEDYHQQQVKKLNIDDVSKSFYCQHKLVLDCKEQCFKSTKIANEK